MAIPFLGGWGGVLELGSRNIGEALLLLNY